MNDNGQKKSVAAHGLRKNSSVIGDYVLEKSIFSNVFQKDIRRAYLYKRAERIAKVVFLIAPALVGAPVLHERAQAAGLALIDAALKGAGAERESLSRELLSLASLLSIAKSSGFISDMNADIVLGEVRLLLDDIAAYEPPRLMLEPALSTRPGAPARIASPRPRPLAGQEVFKGHLSDIKDNSSRTEAILAAVRAKGSAYMKDISAVVRDVSEKTIQRELQTLVTRGVLRREGERRWTLYSIA